MRLRRSTASGGNRKEMFCGESTRALFMQGEEVIINTDTGEYVKGEERQAQK